MGLLLDNRCIEKARKYKRPFIVFLRYDFPDLIHGFTTRFGGVSTGDYATLNLNFNRSDSESNVKRIMKF